MLVGVIHHIHDPEGFRTAAAETAPRALAEAVELALKATSRDHRVGFCVWEGDSVAAVRDFVELAIGPFADNEYYEMAVDGLARRPRHGRPSRQPR